MEGLDEDELALFDLLTRPDPPLNDERGRVRSSARDLLAKIQEAVVIDWRRKADARNAMRVAIRETLDATLPIEPYPRAVYDDKVDRVFEHVLASSLTDQFVAGPVDPQHVGGLDELPSVAETLDVPPGRLTDDDLQRATDFFAERLRIDAAFASQVAAARDVGPQLRTVEELLAGAESEDVEFKSTARWDLREDRHNRAMEDAVVKTIAGFLNTHGGTLLVGVADDGKVLGLDADYQKVRPRNGDGLVSWLETHLIRALGGTVPVTRIRSRIVVHEGHELARIDVARSPDLVMARTSKRDGVCFVRLSNSTRVLPQAEIEEYRRTRE